MKGLRLPLQDGGERVQRQSLVCARMRVSAHGRLDRGWAPGVGTTVWGLQFRAGL